MKCGRYGHWYNDRASDGSIHTVVTSSDLPIKDPDIYRRQAEQKRDRSQKDDTQPQVNGI